MKKKHLYLFYIITWSIATIFLLTLFWQMTTYSRIINYSGILRGGTQKLSKEELYLYEDDDLINELDGILYDLQTGEGDYGIVRNPNDEYQQLLAEMEVVWMAIKEEIYQLRENKTSQDGLFSLSQQYYYLADKMVVCAENDALDKAIEFITFYFATLVFSIGIFIYANFRNNQELKKTLATDKLTGLHSRMGFEEKATHILHQNPHLKYTVIEFDIDNFSFINNTYGFVLGDKILITIADALTRGPFSELLCARIDSDSFIILIEKSSNIITQLELTLLSAINKLDCANYIGRFTFTFGGYDIAYNSEEIKVAMDKATIAHKVAKTSDTATIWYDDTLLKNIEKEHYYNEHLHQGIENREFQMYLQPQVDLKTMETVGGEALVRWKLPNNDLIFPDTFIPLFEKKGIMSELDFYMLDLACARLKQHLDEGYPEITIAVNFSRLTLYQSNFSDNFIAMVDKYKLPHHCIEIEVVETALNEVQESVIEMLEYLDTQGFKISMDDFGAGYSNLSCLSTLPVHTVKLDRQFLVEVEHNENMKTITTSVIDMAHKLGMTVLCEGVEEEHHVQFLKEIGCDYAQGYYFARPVPNEAFSLSLISDNLKRKK